jgi:hypothetical protein
MVITPESEGLVGSDEMRDEHSGYGTLEKCLRPKQPVVDQPGFILYSTVGRTYM